MEVYNLKKEDIKIHNIVYAVTSPIDYEMSRFLLLEDMPNTDYNEYVVVEGYHCSCYGFDDTKWEAIKYTKEELKKLAKIKKNDDDGFCWKEEKNLWNYIDKMFN